MIAGLYRRFAKSERANVAVIFALALVPTIYLTGMGVDYTLAVDRQTELDAASDAAALSAVTPTMMAGSTTASQQQAINTFNAQASQITNTNYSPGNVTVTIATSGAVRTATVTWAAKSVNSFPNVLGMTTIAIGGSSQATAGLAPDINFYLMLDDSPSMAIPATTAGITQMNTLTSTTTEGSCAFACHESNPSPDKLGNPSGEDNYAYARANNITLRIDNLKAAAENLASTAKTTETNSTASYQMAIYTFDVGVNTIAAMTSNLTTVGSDAANISLLEVYDNNNLTSSTANNDMDTNWDGAMSSMNTTMPNPGSGTATKGDTPQEVLFIVTDGVVDETSSGSPPLNSAYGSYNGSRQQSTVNPAVKSGTPKTDWCATIKNRGIRIAVLYTEYLPLNTSGQGSNAWYTDYVAPIQSNIGTQLQACASPGLYYEVTTDGDISAALADLFDLAVQSAYLSK